MLVGEGRGEVEAPPSRSFKAGRKGMGGFCSAAFARARVWMRDPDTALLLMCGPEKGEGACVSCGHDTNSRLALHNSTTRFLLPRPALLSARLSRFPPSSPPPPDLLEQDSTSDAPEGR